MDGQQETQAPEDEYKVYTLNEVARILKTTKRTLYNLINQGKLKAVKVGGNWLIKKETLDAMFNSDSK